MLRRGDRIGDWIIDSPLGEGGMGAVFRVHSALSGRVEAALKVMKPSGEPDARARFVREAEALSALHHPAIVRVMGFSEDPARGLLYLVMELAVGETLKRRLERGPMPLPEALATFVPLAAALEHAHAAGIFHRDLKPSNVILCADGVRLVDFGIAAAARDETLSGGGGQLGTLSYLPPEIFRGERAQPRAMDVYAFGLLLDEALTGRHPFPVEQGMTPAAAAASVGMRKVNHPALDPGEGAPPAVRDLVRRATDPDPRARPDMAEVARVLASLVERRGTAAAVGAALPSARMPLWTPPADATTRVPDPVLPGAGRPGDRTTSRVRRRFRERRRSMIVAWVVSMFAAALAASLIILMVRGPAGRETEPPSPAPAPSAERPPRRARALPALPSAAPSPDGGPAFPSPSPNPRPTPSPSPSLGPSPSPRTSPSPSPSSTAPRPGPAGAGPATAAGPAEDNGEDTYVSGDWMLVNRIDATDYAPFQGLRVGYHLSLRQDGTRITGEGEKQTENGAPLPPAQRSAIVVAGHVENGTLILHFTERGALRTSSGTFRWRIASGQDHMSGSFASDAAASRGSSSLQRVP